MNLKLIRYCTFSCVAMYGLGSHAALVHRYTFNDGTANDSVGTADGTLVGTAGIGGFGFLNLTGGGPGDSYLDLPDGIASAASAGGIDGEISTEAWVEINSNTDWAVIFSFGNSGPGVEDNDGSDGDYWQLIPQSGGTGPFRSTTHIAANAEVFIDDAGPLTTGAIHHVVNVLNVANDKNELYLNGSLVATGALQPGFDPNTYGAIGDTQNWLGRSQWGDASLNGSYAEFSIYDHALSAAEVATNFAGGVPPGPTIPLTPTLTVNRDSGSLTLQNGQTASQVVGYSIQSAFGSLDQAGWTTITNNIDAPPGGDGSFDNDDEWTVLTATGSHGDLSEFEFDGGDGGSMAVGEFLTLSSGDAWIQSPTEDLTMELKLDDGSTVSVAVQYEGNGGDSFARSDLNFDGNINGLDWPVLRDNSNVDLSSFSLAEAYARGDLDGDGDNDYRDYLQFRTDFNTANGAGAFEAFIGSAIPEPCSTVLLVGMAAFYCFGRFRL